MYSFLYPASLIVTLDLLALSNTNQLLDQGKQNIVIYLQHADELFSDVKEVGT